MQAKRIRLQEMGEERSIIVDGIIVTRLPGDKYMVGTARRNNPADHKTLTEALLAIVQHPERVMETVR